jgi:transcriptional regulator with XRE-family HTH domain
VSTVGSSPRSAGHATPTVTVVRGEPVTTFDGTRLATIRAAAGWTAVELAAALDVAHSRVSEWEHGRVQPSPQMLWTIAATLGVATVDLLTRAPVTLTEIRHAAGWGRSDVADHLDVGYATLYAIETGRRALSPDRARQLAALYKTPLRALLAAAAHTASSTSA